MVRGLQRTAEDGRKERFAAAQAATRARRDATKLAAAASAPLPVIEPPKVEPPQKPRLSLSAIKPGKSPPKLANDVEATPPTSLFVESSPFKVAASMGAMLTPRLLLTPKRKPSAAATAAKRMKNLKLSRAWAAWIDAAAATRVQRKACAILMQPHVSRAMETWCEWYDERVHALATLHHAVHAMSMTCEIRAFSRWAQIARLRSLTRDAALILSVGSLVSALRSWHRIASHRAFHKRYQESG